MTEKRIESNITKINPNLPAYMQEDGLMGTEELSKIVRPPLLRIIQKSSSDDLLEKFDKGDLIIRPADALVASYNNGNPDKFLFTPIIYWREFVTWAPLTLKGQVPAVLGTTRDENSALARKAMDATLREEEIQYEGMTFTANHVAHLNFLFIIQNNDAMGFEPALFSFCRGEYVTGTKFASMIKQCHAPIFSRIYEGQVSPTPRSNQKGSWYGLDINNPTDDISPWVDSDLYAQYKDLYEKFSISLKSDNIKTDYESSESSESDESDGYNDSDEF